jgi:hypothetical protein
MNRDWTRPTGLVVVAAFATAMFGCAADKADKQATARKTEPPVKKIKIEKLDDLPQHTYPYAGDVGELIQSHEQVLALAKKVRADVQSDLDTYEIDDRTTLQRMYGTLLTCDLLEGNHQAALKRLNRIRDLEGKEAARLMSGLSTRAMIAARHEVRGHEIDARYRAAFQRHFAASLAPLPWDVVEDEVQQRKGRMEIFSESLLLGAVGGQMQPAVDRTGEFDADMAAGILGVHLMITERLPLKAETIAAYEGYIAANRKEKPDIWADRAVTLSHTEPCEPVLLAVWDSGTDASCFRRQLWTNKAERVDGVDNDGNGFVDDVHGIAYDIHARRAVELLYPLGDASGRIQGVMDHMKGLMDLQADVDSAEAKALKRYLSALDPERVEAFLEDLNLAGNYAHGTHVAGIMLDGNPHAELLIARLSYDHRTVPVARTPEWGRRDAAKCRDTVDYFKRNGVRVVNMSWGEKQDDAESSLEMNGVGESAEARREMAREVFGYQKEGLYEAIKNAPDILFVCAAGNSDNDVEFDVDIPSSFDLPNLLVVGAVDQAGEPTGFTSFGRTVEVYASGFEVDSYVPGGQRMKMSGTSMASPNVANTAGKLLAIDPSLSPPEVIELIKKGSDRRQDGEHEYLLLNPKRSVELARTGRG